MPMTIKANHAAKQARRDRLVLEHLLLVKAIAVHVRANLPLHVDLDYLVHSGILGGQTVAILSLVVRYLESVINLTNDTAESQTKLQFDTGVPKRDTALQMQHLTHALSEDDCSETGIADNRSRWASRDPRKE